MKKVNALIRQVAKANAMLLVQYAVGSLVPLLLVPHIVKVIGLAEYGHLAVLMVWGSYGSIVIQYGFQMTGPKRLANLEAGETPASIFIDIAFAKLILLSLVIPVLAVVTPVSTNFEFNSLFAWGLLYAMPIAVALNSVWFLQAQGRFLHVSILAIIGSLFTLLIGFVYIDSGNDHAIDFAVAVSVFGSLFTGAGTFLLAISSIKKQRYMWKLTRVINALKDGWYLFISQFVSMFYSVSGPLIISHLTDSKSAGAFSVTERVMSTLMAAALLTHTAAYPILASAFVKSRSDYWRALKFIIIGYLSVVLIIAVMVLVFYERTLLFLYNEINSDRYLMLFIGLLWLMMGIFGPVLTGYLTISGRSREILSINIKVLLISIVFGVPGVFLFGGAGWMGAVVIAQFFSLYAGLKYWIEEYGK